MKKRIFFAILTLIVVILTPLIASYDVYSEDSGISPATVVVVTNGDPKPPDEIK